MGSIGDAESVAEEVLRLAGQRQPPVNLAQVVGLWPDLSLKAMPLDGDGYFLDLGECCAEIVVSSTIPPTRQRYTIAHELGHWLLLANQVRQEEEFSSQRAAEKWCDRFAASLLLPVRWVARLVRTTPLADLPEALDHASHVLQVSRFALYQRVVEMTSLTICEMSRVRGKPEVDVRYSRTGDGMPSDEVLQFLGTLLDQRQAPRKILHEQYGLVSAQAEIGRNRWLVCFSSVRGPAGHPLR